MRKAALLAALFCAGICLTATGGEGASLTVVTYNIHHGEGMDGKLDLERIAALVLSMNPDVVCLQEMDKNLPRTGKRDFPAWFAERLKMEARYGVNYHFDGGEYGVATLTRLPVLGWENTALPNPFNKEPRGCLRVTVEWKGAPVDVYNTHLGLKGEERLAQAEALLELIPADKPAVLAGDMNEGPGAPGMKLLLERFSDALAGAGAGDNNAHPAEKRIDHVLMTKGLKACGARVVDTEVSRVASDHPPCVVVLEGE